MLKNTYNKEVSHRTNQAYIFNVQVNLAESVELGEEGKTFHSIIVTDTGSSGYLAKRNCESSELESTIDDMIAEAKTWAIDRDSAGKDPEELLLESIGFE